VSLLSNITAIQGYPSWQLHVASYRPTTPTECLSNAGRSIALNIAFLGFLLCLWICLVWTMRVKNATENLLDHQLVLVSSASVDVNPHSTTELAINKIMLSLDR
jgi:hypothetical protein